MVISSVEIGWEISEFLWIFMRLLHTGWLSPCEGITQMPAECIGSPAHLFLQRVIITVSLSRNEPFVLCFQ
jgi:hypothetical protein